MSTTGFKLSDGRDLSVLFETYTTGTQADPTGFKVSSGADLNTVFAKNTSGTYTANNTSYIAQPGQDLRLLFEPIVPLTVTGPGTYSLTVSGTTYKYTFTAGTNNITIKKPITSLYVIVAGGGGGGSPGSIGSSGAGGGGGGFGSIVISTPAINQQYNTSVAATEGNSTFYNLSNNGVMAYGGSRGSGVNRATPGGTCVTVGTLTGAGTLTVRTGGNGGAGRNGGGDSGSNSSGSITVLGTTYNYGGGGSGGGTFTVGGKAGANGLGGIGYYNSGGSGGGQTATTPGSGGGGGSYDTDYDPGPGWGGNGARGEVVVTFVYP